MAIVPRYNAQIFEGTEAEFTASTKIWDQNDLLITSDTNVWKIGNGVHKWSELEAVGGEEQTELATKVNKAGDTMTGQLIVADPTDQSRLILAKTMTETENAPTTFDKSSIYLNLGGAEYKASSYRLIGFGWRKQADENHAPAVVGYQEVSGSGSTHGKILFATRNTNSDVAPTVWMTIEPDGSITAQSTAKFVGDGSGLTGLTDAQIPAIPQSKVTDLTTALAAKLTATTAQFNAKLTASQGAAQADSTATDIAGLVADFNSLLAKLRTANIIAT